MTEITWIILAIGITFVSCCLIFARAGDDE